MRLDLLRGMAFAGGVLLAPAVPALADTADDLKRCLSAGSTYDADVEQACDRYIDTDGTRDSDRAKAYFAHARVVAAKGDYDTAVDDMDDSIPLAGSKDAYLARAFYLIKIEEYEDAIDDADAVIKKDSRNAEAYYLRGRARYEIDEDSDDAFDDLSRAIKLSPTHGNAYLWRGHLLLDAAFDLEHAIEDLTQAIRYLRDTDRESARAVAFYSRGEAYYYDDRVQDALSDVQEALDLIPDYVDAHWLRAECLEAIKHFDEAIAEYGTVIRLSPASADAFTARAAAYVTSGHPADALKDYTKSIALNSASAGNYYGRGRAFRALDKHDESLADLKVYIDKAPKAVVGPLELGRTYTAMGDTANAEASYRTALELANASITTIAYSGAYEQRAEINVALRQYDDAVDDFSAAIRIMPGNAKYYYGRAAAYDLMGNVSKADADRAKAQRLESGEPADADATDETADEDDDDGSWGVTGAGTMQKMH